MIYVFRMATGSMRSQAEIEKELAQKERMLGNSEAMDQNVRPYVEALKWVLEGEAEQIGAVRIGEWNQFDKAVLCARTNGGKLFISETVPDNGVYSLLRYERITDS